LPPGDHTEYVRRINRTHLIACASEKWTINGGQYVDGLENWLRPTKERYLVELPPSVFGSAVGYRDMEAWKGKSS
jgi:hypothetical protein